MGYFDALTSSAFKTTNDGQRLFFPWGILTQGYVIPTEADFERLRHDYKNIMKFTMIFSLLFVIVLWNFSSWSFLFKGIVTVAFLLVYIVAYNVWVRFRCHNLSPAHEKLTYSECAANQARTFSTVQLWLFEVGSLAFVAGGVWILLTDPNQWLIAVSSIAFFGLCAVVFTRMIVIKRRETRTRR
jgi:hypothetical protein